MNDLPISLLEYRQNCSRTSRAYQRMPTLVISKMEEMQDCRIWHSVLV